MGPSERKPPGRSRVGAVARLALWNGAATVALLLLFEGAASLFVALTSPVETGPELAHREARHTKYDAELGWINEPDLEISDMYGAGRDFSTNARSFRGRRDYAELVPPGRVRVVCSGDSFTMGYGVGDEDTWCQKLTAVHPRIEAVNLGVGGYGVGQSYLWYRRNLDRLAHDVHVFAFISADFTRLARPEFLGYGKPLLTLEGDRLTVRNVPVPGPALGTRAPHRLRETLGRLHAVEVLRGLLGSDEGEAHQDVGATRAVALRIFEELHDLARLTATTVVLVHLPTRSDYMAPPNPNGWRSFVAAEATRRGWHFIDVTADFRTLPRADVDPLFRGHYSEAGNAWVARVVGARLLGLPEVAARLQAAASHATVNPHRPQAPRD